MSRPVPEGHDTVHDAINRIIPARFADRHAEIVRRSGADDQTWKRDAVATVDPNSDALIENGRQPSRQLQDLVQEVFEDARRLLRQWLRDGKVQAFCSDPLFGGDIKIAPSAWGLQTTDRAIAGGDAAAAMSFVDLCRLYVEIDAGVVTESSEPSRVRQFRFLASLIDRDGERLALWDGSTHADALAIASRSAGNFAAPTFDRSRRRHR